MFKTLIFAGIILSNLTVVAESNIILKMGNNTITEDKLKPKTEIINSILKKIR